MMRSDVKKLTSGASVFAVETPIGCLRVVSDKRGIVATRFAADRRPGDATTAKAHSGPVGAGDVVAALRAYFDEGRLDALAGIAVHLEGSVFEERVWRALRGIPPGRVESYGALARRLGVPEAARAVGLAAARNPLALFVPCHRLVGSDGALTGYAYGIARKRWLLEHEGALPMPLGWEQERTGTR